jgi:hypothetical protein
VSYSALRLCSGRSAFEAIPDPRLSLDLAHVRARIQAEGVPVIDARVMLIAGKRQEVTIGRDGRILLKVPRAAEADRLFERVLGWIDRPRA